MTWVHQKLKNYLFGTVWSWKKTPSRTHIVGTVFLLNHIFLEL